MLELLEEEVSSLLRLLSLEVDEELVEGVLELLELEVLALL